MPWRRRQAWGGARGVRPSSSAEPPSARQGQILAAARQGTCRAHCCRPFGGIRAGAWLACPLTITTPSCSGGQRSAMVLSSALVAASTSTSWRTACPRSGGSGSILDLGFFAFNAQALPRAVSFLTIQRRARVRCTPPLLAWLGCAALVGVVMPSRPPRRGGLAAVFPRAEGARRWG